MTDLAGRAEHAARIQAQWRRMRVVTLQDEPPLSITSFEEAYKIIGEAGPLLICGPGHEDIIAWLWDAHRDVTVCISIHQVLGDTLAWALQGTDKSVVSVPK